LSRSTFKAGGEYDLRSVHGTLVIIAAPAAAQPVQSFTLQKGQAIRITPDAHVAEMEKPAPIPAGRAGAFDAGGFLGRAVASRAGGFARSFSCEKAAG
jgi:hypothetical protein